MKTIRILILRPLALCAMFLLFSSAIRETLSAVDLRIISECSSNTLTLRWYGAPGFALQQTTNLANPAWTEVPGTKGMSFCETPMTQGAVFFRVANVDAAVDIDADHLDDWLETNGWQIVIDPHGYGTAHLVVREVSSDPSMADTDEDGIEDFWEWLIGTDPRSSDTDGDGLLDDAEWFQWRTSPTSADTDADSRGPNRNLPPKAQLFDGNEVQLLHTSPTLEDTDGDGRTDYEEYDEPGRNPLVAQLPDLVVELVDDVDVRLDVQYAEAAGQSHQYGGVLTTSDTTGQQTSESHTKSWSVEAGASYKFGLSGGLTLSVRGTYGQSSSRTFTTSSSHTLQTSSSEYNTDSRTRTETAASGSMVAGIRLLNTGPVTYTLTDLGMTVRYWSPGGGGTNRTFKTLAMLVPPLGTNGITLAPGDSTPVLPVHAAGLNASRVKEFMARPDSLYLEPAFYELENAQGLNFDFLEEVTRWRTARVEIDYGNGTNEQYRVATNVERNEDGSYAGISMGNVMSNLLHIPFQTTNIQAFVPSDDTNATDERVLYSVRQCKTTSVTNGFWIVGWSGEGVLPAGTDFEDIILRAGDEILLTFIRDEDGDGLFAPEEQHHRTEEGAPGATSDSDADGLTDLFEARTGWDVVVTNASAYHVFSDPAQGDQDGDGLSDAEELARGTDPTRPDTDQDGISDRYDLFALAPAKVLRVKANAAGLNDGSSWANALTDLQSALSLARTGLATSSDSSDDIAEIWVAAGVYKPTTATNDRGAAFQLVNNTALYGGFAGVEAKLSQRNPDPLSNDTILSGDLLGNDTSTPWDNPATYEDNSLAVCTASSGIGPGTILDGFTITSGNSGTSYGGGLYSHGRPTLKNLFFRANTGRNGAAIYSFPQNAASEPYVISDCLFLQNSAVSGGGIRYNGSLMAQTLVLTNCHFYQNISTGTGQYEHAGALVINGNSDIDGCTFAWNSSANRGGAVWVFRGSIVRISQCQFIGNMAAAGGAGLYMSDFNTVGDLKVEIAQSVFWGNSTPSYGGAIWAQGTDTVNKERLYLLNCTIVSNTASAGGAAMTLDNCVTWIENSILWGNTNRVWTGSMATIRTTCLAEAASYPGAGNINADPKFVDPFGGNLRLQATSPCIDRGNNYIDYSPTLPGWQPLPPTDMDGNWRIVDGNNDGYYKVDMGAYERQE